MAGVCCLLLTLGLLLPALLPGSHFAQAQAGGTVMVTSDAPAQSGGGVYRCDLSSGKCTLMAALSWADLGIVCPSSSTCLVTYDNEANVGGGVYSCNLNSGICTRVAPLNDASGMVCPSSTTCLVTSDGTAAPAGVAGGGGIYSCDLTSGTCTRMAKFGYGDSLACDPSSTQCYVTEDRDGNAGGVYSCDLGTGVCTLAAPPLEDLYGSSGIVCSSPTNCMVSADAPISFSQDYYGGVHACDLGTGVCDYKAELEWADSLICPSSTNCLVTSDSGLGGVGVQSKTKKFGGVSIQQDQQAGGVYSCDLNSGICTLVAALAGASGITAFTPGVVVIPEYPFGLAVLAIFIVVGYGLIRGKKVGKSVTT